MRRNYFQTIGMEPLKDLMPGYAFPDGVVQAFQDYRWVITGLYDHPVADTFNAFFEANDQLERYIATLRGYDAEAGEPDSFERIVAEFKSDEFGGMRLAYNKLLGDMSFELRVGEALRPFMRRVNSPQNTADQPEKKAASAVINEREAETEALREIAAIGEAFSAMRQSAEEAMKQPLTIEQRELLQVRLDLLQGAVDYAQAQREFDPLAKTGQAI